MIYRDFQGEKISALAFGTMRLPQKNGAIDEETTAKMVEYALQNGVNYFDTAYPYHGGMSERVMGKILSAYPREKYFLATKFPGHQIAKKYNPRAIFEEQLQKCRVSYFDFYLLHNVCETSLPVYDNPEWGIVDYLLEQKKAGKIRHLGFSSHGRLDNMETFLQKYGKYMEFCQIQLNYLDWTLQEGKEKCELLARYGIPIWVMEPVRGGRLARLTEQEESKLKSLRPGESVASWAFRFLLMLPNIVTVLSGMSNFEQMQDNVKTFSCDKPLSEEEKNLLLAIAEGMKNSLPCTACGYCKEGCPRKLDIPTLIASYNDVRFSPEGGLTACMLVEQLPEDKKPSACIGCGACSAVCPQKIDIPKALQEFSDAVEHLPKWSAICKQREIDNDKNKPKD